MARNRSMGRAFRRSAAFVALVLAGGLLPACKGGGGDGGSGGAGPGGSQGGGSGVTVDADLVAASLTPGASSLEAGDLLPVTFRVRNTGPDAVPAFRAALRLSADDLLDASDPLLGTWSTAGLPASADFDVAGSVQVPVVTVPGAYRLLLVADDDQRLAETDESNNLLVSLSTVSIAPPTHPDLAAEAVSFGPSTVQAGDTIDVSHQIRNIGVEPSSGFRLGIYLSTTGVITTSDVLIGQRSIPALGVGEVDSASGSVTIPSFVSAGSYFVGILCDDLGQVVEMDEINNGLAATATLTVNAAPLPDMAPLSVQVQQSTVDAGQPILFEESVLNQGVAAAPLFQVGLYLSTDLDIDPSEDVFLGSRAVASLDAGATSASGPQSLMVPGNTPGGAYFVGVVVDAGEFVPESNEGNNTLLASTALSVTVPPLPDLRTDTFTFGPSSVVANGTERITVTASFGNGGVAPSAAVQATVFLSTDFSVTTADIPVGSIDVPTLDPGAGVGRTVDLLVPGGIANGSYRVGLWIDDVNIQPELDEANNLFVATELLDITGGGPSAPNLIGEDIDPSASTVAPGSSLQVVTRVANTGDLSTPAFRVGIYLSTDDEIDLTDTLLGDRLVPFGLGGGFSSVASAPITIPLNTPDGTYRIGVYADTLDSVVESDEEDNGLVASGNFIVQTPPPPRPNLVVSSASSNVGSTASAGDVVDLTHEIRNSGDLAAGTFRVGLYLSSDDTIDAADTLLSSRLITELGAGSSDSLTSAVQIPAGTAAGTWFLGVLVDDQDAVTESNESDNDRAVTPSFDL